MDDFYAEEYDALYSDDSESEPDVNLENQYYCAKSLKQEKKYNEALQAFQVVRDLEVEKGEWGFKALKQMIKISYHLNDYEKMIGFYDELLSYIRTSVTRNYSEKSINSILDFISSAKNNELLLKFYQTTLDALEDVKNERLWFKTNAKLGKLYFEQRQFGKLSKVIKQMRLSCKNAEGDEDLKKGTQLLEIYALEIQMYTEQKNNKALKSIYEQSLQVKSAIPHPLIMGIIRECGGKMHLREGKFENAHTDFFEAFKNFDESGSDRRVACLKYLVLANMLIRSDINPFDSQEAKPFRNDPEILAISQLITAYQKNDIQEFEAIVKAHHDSIMADHFMREHIEDLITNIRLNALARIIKAYSRVRLESLAERVQITVQELIPLLTELILEGTISGRIDQLNGILIMDPRVDEEEERRWNAMSDILKDLEVLQKCTNFT